MLDANDDIRSSTLTTQLSSLGLTEIIYNQHKDSGSAPTYNRGTYPIDGIFATSSLHIHQGGYLPFGDFPSDHRFIWTKITFASAFGSKMPTLIPPDARRLKMNDPSSVSRFIQTYTSYILKHNLHLYAHLLQHTISINSLTPANIYSYNTLQHLRHQGLLLAEASCRKLKMGEVPWSATLQHAMDTIRLWTIVQSRLRGT